MKIKHVLVKALVGLLNFFSKIGRLFKFSGRPVCRGLTLLGSGVFKLFIFPVYKGAYLLKYKVLNLYAPARSKVFFILNKGYTVHIVIFLLVFVLLANNLRAQEIRPDNYGENSVIYALITKEVYEEPMIEVQVVGTPQDKILSYLDKSMVVGSQQTVPTEQETEMTDALVTELSTVTQGGVAMVKPNIIKPITSDQVPSSQLPDKRGDIVYHAVVAGETFSSIAKKYNIDVNTLLWENNLSSTSVLKLGMNLKILPMIGVSHKVVRGESVSAIANKYKVSTDQILAANNLLDTTDIKIGQMLIIPGGKKIGPTKTTTVAKKTKTAPIGSLFSTAPTTTRSSTTGWAWPLAAKTITQYYKLNHKGLDIAGPLGIAVYAVDDGVVEYSGWSSGYGYNILINHGNGIKTRYAHSNKLYVSKGETVVKGQTIMGQGSTGWSTGPHLHFEVIVNGVKVNPLSYIR